MRLIDADALSEKVSEKIEAVIDVMRFDGSAKMMMYNVELNTLCDIEKLIKDAETFMKLDVKQEEEEKEEEEPWTDDVKTFTTVEIFDPCLRRNVIHPIYLDVPLRDYKDFIEHEKRKRKDGEQNAKE